MNYTGDSSHATPPTHLRDVTNLGEYAAWGSTIDGPHEVKYARWRGRRLNLVRYSGGGVSFTRDERHLGDENDNFLLFAFLHEGSVTVTRDGQTVTHTPGDVAALRLDRPYSSLTEPGSSTTLVYLAMPFLESRGIDTRRVNGNVWEAGKLCEAVVALAERILACENDHDAQVLENGLVEILVGILADHDSDAYVDDVTEQTRARALNLIDERYTDVDLDADQIAAALGASRRYLYGLFEGRGPSIATLIRNRRAAHAEQLLRDEPSFSIRRIAHLSGFGSEDRLLRTFKTMTGESPSAYRRRVTAGEAGNGIPDSVQRLGARLPSKMSSDDKTSCGNPQDK